MAKSSYEAASDHNGSANVTLTQSAPFRSLEPNMKYQLCASSVVRLRQEYKLGQASGISPARKALASSKMVSPTQTEVAGTIHHCWLLDDLVGALLSTFCEAN